MGFYLEIRIRMIGSLIKISDSKPHPASIGDESLYIWIPLAKKFKGIPALMTVTCRDIQEYDLEYAAAIKFRSIALMGFGLICRYVV